MNESSEIILTKPTQNPSRVKSYIRQGIGESSSRKLVARDLTLARTRRDIEKNKQQARKYEELTTLYANLSLTDSLTGLYNRRFLTGDKDRVGILESTFKIAQRGDDPISVVMIDMDRLKEINDENGHMIGDIMIKSIAKEIKDSIRHSDFAIRYGGDEILLILPVTNEEGAIRLTEEIQKKVRALSVMGKDSPLVLTLSSGIVSLRPKNSLTTDPIDLIRAADKALYQAKQHGRNQTWIAIEKEIKDGEVVFDHRPLTKTKT